jgi:hypothetical protein
VFDDITADQPRAAYDQASCLVVGFVHVHLDHSPDNPRIALTQETIEFIEDRGPRTTPGAPILAQTGPAGIPLTMGRAWLRLSPARVPGASFRAF